MTDDAREAGATNPPPDTIAAIATPAGHGGIGIVRVSGAKVPALARSILGDLPEPKRAAVRRFRDGAGQAIDAGIALFYEAPSSFTGEHVLELQAHGGPVVLDLLLRRCLELGARAARAGEFSERAFLNDKLDLAQAEAVADLIAAGSAAAARAALRSLNGEFSRRIETLSSELIALRTEVEAAIDFADEDLELPAEAAIRERLARLDDEFEALERTAEQGRILHEGFTLVIAGRPNAGKSSLLNVLSGHEAAIVTELPGTTRDVLKERIAIDGLPVTILDTAGLRDSPDVVEAEGIRRAHREIVRADRVLYVVDAADPSAVESAPTDIARLPGDVPVSVVLNKADLGAAAASIASTAPQLRVSARTGVGVEALRTHLKSVAGYASADAGVFSARRRHLEALARAHAHAASAERSLEDRLGSEIVAEELRLAHEALDEITGRFTSEDLLGRIFASFCIGK